MQDTGFQPQTILLAEDDDNDVLLIRRTLEKSRISNPLQVVCDGEEVLGYLAGEGHFADRQSHPFPVLMLLDLKLPKKSGFEIIEAVRRHPQWCSLPIVAFVSSKGHPDIERARNLGANACLVKPPTFEALVEVLKSLDAQWAIVGKRPTP